MRYISIDSVPIPWAPQYEITRDGQVWSHISNKFLKQHDSGTGYLKVWVAGKHCYVHRLICEAFNGPHPAGKEFVNHIDGDKRNNDSSNLEWVSCAENNRHAYEHGLKVPNHASFRKAQEPSRKAVVGTSKDGKTVIFDSVSEAKKNGFGHVSECLHGWCKTCGGYRWEVLQ